ncbi:ABC transporter substrate-binding protein [Nocardioides sp. Soil805]|uniref:ABC transporter substrate-binding protein n=1 Tax=Nocardioides sp. Soil805 TaxID=1736416 RepID=UPI00070296F2|nr:ABC transporter substrate-binding protein [Nocardioides sp. Soil805]KRF37796.1 sugar ABC transporter substrate-binding protein [Nocardioides sp. Soil805]
MAASRRSVLRGMALGGLALGSGGLLAACGGDDGGGGSSGSGTTVKFGINEAKGSGPAYDRLAAMAAAYTKETDTKVDLNAVDHNTFQESVNTYLQGTPDDVFTWFAGFRMAQFAEAGLITDLSDVWPIDGMNDSFKEASTAPDGKQYFVPKDYYPWAVFYRKSIFEKNGWTAPETKDDLMSLMDDMQGKGITPFAFGDKQGWPAMGTFDILNMRLNGFDFHMSLMAGDEQWDGDEVKLVFETWKTLLPYHQEDPLGRNWEEAATSMGNGECGMYLLGTFVADAVADVADDLDFFTFPELDSSIGADALDAPIDGFCVAAGGQNQEAGKAMAKWLGSAAAADAANSGADVPFIAANSGASTSSYSALQKKSAEVVGAAANIAQFMDRDTNADFANTVMVPSIQDFLKNPDDIDGITSSIQEQAASIFG